MPLGVCDQRGTLGVSSSVCSAIYGAVEKARLVEAVDVDGRVGRVSRRIERGDQPSPEHWNWYRAVSATFRIDDGVAIEHVRVDNGRAASGCVVVNWLSLSRRKVISPLRIPVLLSLHRALLKLASTIEQTQLHFWPYRYLVDILSYVFAS